MSHTILVIKMILVFSLVLETYHVNLFHGCYCCVLLIIILIKSLLFYNIEITFQVEQKQPTIYQKKLKNLKKIQKSSKLQCTMMSDFFNSQLSQRILITRFSFFSLKNTSQKLLKSLFPNLVAIYLLSNLFSNETLLSLQLS